MEELFVMKSLTELSIACIELWQDCLEVEFYDIKDALMV